MKEKPLQYLKLLRNIHALFETWFLNHNPTYGRGVFTTSSIDTRDARGD